MIFKTNRGMYAEAFNILNENEPLNESEQLLEDKVVKFGGEMFPKFGWCVILMGGAASGKGSAFNRKVAIEGDYYNPDNLKEIKRMWKIRNTTHGANPTGRPYEDDFETPTGRTVPLRKKGKIVRDKDGNIVTQDSKRNMKNSEFVGQLHNTMDGLSKAWKKSLIDRGEDESINRDRLPNMIFDITGKKLTSIKEIVDVVKPQGYKVAIVWILSEAKLTFKNNAERDRSVKDSILASGHLGVIKTAEEIFSSNYISSIDEFWVVDTAQGIGKDYHKQQNVYQIPTTPDGLNEFEFIGDRLEHNKRIYTKKNRY